jgi:PadR family transcriptional regulator PadR
MWKVPGTPPHHHRRLQRSYYFTIIEDMRKRDYLGQLELMVLFAVMRVNMNAYGVLISQEISKQSGRDVSIASVYAALERLEKKGLITSLLGEPTAERGGKARTYFKPTAAGLKEARDAHGTLMRLSSGLPGLKGQIA